MNNDYFCPEILLTTFHLIYSFISLIGLRQRVIIIRQNLFWRILAMLFGYSKCNDEWVETMKFRYNLNYYLGRKNES